MKDPRQMPERQLHGYVADLLRLTARRNVLWLHIANEGVRSPRTGAFLVRMGMRPGAADFLIVIGGRAFFLEIKRITGRQSPDQKVFAAAAEAAGAVYAVARTPEQAKAVLTGWGALRPDSMADIIRGMQA